jgi:FtsP/CotA-like multicopper oxidase with cupredoxin domain
VTRIHRRNLLQLGLSTGGLLLARRALGQDNPWAIRADDFAARTPTFAATLPIPPSAKPVRSDQDGDVYELAIRAGSAQPLEGPPTPILGYDGVWPGPTIRAQRGRPVRIRFKNELADKVSVHNHGLHTAASSDGHPLDHIATGKVKEYLYPNDQTPGTYWYHDHAMGLTGPHVYQGLAGLYLIEDPAEAALRLPSGAYDVPIVLQDRVFDAGNALVYTVNAGTMFTGYLGNTMCTNGVHVPRFEVAARRYRFRFLNGANSRNFRLALDDNAPLVQIASDGALLRAPIARTAVDLAPSERADCVIDFSRYPVGTKLLLKNQDPTWPTLPDVMRFDVVRKERDDSAIPDKLAVIERLDVTKPAETRTIKFGLADGRWTLNGLLYDPARVDFRPKLGTTEIWQLHNTEATQMHPFHQHLVKVQVLDIDGAPPPPHLAGWKDTVPVGPSAKVRIAMRFTGVYTGVYVFHCHKLEHEDSAMMLQQEIVS